jgi:hypothetical protein
VTSDEQNLDPSLTDDRERARVGLCYVCRQARRIRSDRGSVFYFCQRSQTDPRFPKYPRLPVNSCSGFDSPEETTPRGSS